MEIHPTAIVHSRAEIGEGVIIGPYSYIGEGVIIGEKTEIASFVRIESGTTLGRGCKISHGAAIGGLPQDQKFKGGKSYCIIGDNTVVREYATIHRGSQEGSVTKVGNGCLLMAYSHIAHNCWIGDGTIIANGVNLAGNVTIEKYAIVGGITPVHQFVRIGCYSIVGGASRVSKDVLPYTKVAGNPLHVYGLNRVGLVRHNFPLETRRLLERAYRLIFRSQLNTSQALERIKNELPLTTEIKHLIEFIEGSKRGITK